MAGQANSILPQPGFFGDGLATHEIATVESIGRDPCDRLVGRFARGACGIMKSARKYAHFPNCTSSECNG